MFSSSHIVFITTSNLATNPRLVKEIELSISLNFSTTVFCFHFSNWSESLNLDIKKRLEKSVEFVELSANRFPFFPWLLSSLFQLFSLLLLRLGLSSKFILSQALHKRSFLLHFALLKVKNKPDFVIAHNPGSFYPAFHFANRKKTHLGFDIEDYHPGETNNIFLQNTTLTLLKKILPKADYCSYASPLIALETKKNIPRLINRQLVILNSFSKNDFIFPTHVDDDKLRLVWFSQNIDVGRGLENVIPVINKNYPKVELHLIGSLNETFNDSYLANKNGIVIHKPMSQTVLHHFLSKFDVGLATDIPVTLNRDIALTNKILAYAQSGLFIISMYTRAQDLFLKESDLKYHQVENSFKSIELGILYAYDLKMKKQLFTDTQYLAGQNYNWEKASNSLSELWLAHINCINI